MSTAQQTNGHNDINPLLRAVVQIIGLIPALIWTIAFLSLFVGHSGPNTPLIWTGILIAMLGAPVFFFFVLPALIYTQWGGPSGAKVGAALLLVGLIVTAAIVAWQFVGPAFR
jgi:hypothetical protein